MRKGKFMWDSDKQKIKFVEDQNSNFNLLPFPDLIEEMIPKKPITDLGTAFGIALFAQHEKELLPSTCEPNPSYSAGLDPWRNDGQGIISIMATGGKTIEVDIEKDWEEMYKKIEEIGKYYKASIFVEENYNLTFRQFLNLQELIKETKEKSKINIIKYGR